MLTQSLSDGFSNISIQLLEILSSLIEMVKPLDYHSTESKICNQLLHAWVTSGTDDDEVRLIESLQCALREITFPAGTNPYDYEVRR
jgi:hypothetical protein